jgi:hypothetical protein
MTMNEKMMFMIDNISMHDHQILVEKTKVPGTKIHTSINKLGVMTREEVEEDRARAHFHLNVILVEVMKHTTTTYTTPESLAIVVKTENGADNTHNPEFVSNMALIRALFVGNNKMSQCETQVYMCVLWEAWCTVLWMHTSGVAWMENPPMCSKSNEGVLMEDKFFSVASGKFSSMFENSGMRDLPDVEKYVFTERVCLTKKMKGRERGTVRSSWEYMFDAKAVATVDAHFNLPVATLKQQPKLFSEAILQQEREWDILLKETDTPTKMHTAHMALNKLAVADGLPNACVCLRLCHVDFMPEMYRGWLDLLELSIGNVSALRRAMQLSKMLGGVHSDRGMRLLLLRAEWVLNLIDIVNQCINTTLVPRDTLGAGNLLQNDASETTNTGSSNQNMNFYYRARSSYDHSTVYVSTRNTQASCFSLSLGSFLSQIECGLLMCWYPEQITQALGLIGVLVRSKTVTTTHVFEGLAQTSENWSPANKNLLKTITEAFQGVARENKVTLGLHKHSFEKFAGCFVQQLSDKKYDLLNVISKAKQKKHFNPKRHPTRGVNSDSSVVTTAVGLIVNPH